MRKVHWFAIGYTLLLALPCALMAMSVLIYLTDYTVGLGGLMTGFINWNRLAVEGANRWPELAGMVVGQLVILGIILIVRYDRRRADESLIEPPAMTDARPDRSALDHKSPPH